MLDPLTEGLAVVTQPIQSIANAPYTVTNALIDFFASRSKMQNRNARLIEEVRELTYGSQRLAAIEAENTRLRALLGSRKRLSEGVLVAEIVGVDPNTQRREVVLDKGERDGVAVSQAVIDAEGLFGQVVATTNSNARVLMVSDPRHAIPIEIVRTGLRSIAVGTGLSDRLAVEHVSTTADVRVGDLLVSSGLGGRFPRGYPVGEILSVDIGALSNYADISASVQARLDTSRHVLILFNTIGP